MNFSRSIILLLTLVLVACGPDSKHIKIDGHLLNLNQGEFLVYSPDGAISGVDTIFIEGGRFSYEPECQHDGTVIIMLPHSQEVPVFVIPGKSYSLDGNAQNLKELKVDGGDENALMNTFRKSVVNENSPVAIGKEAVKFIEEHPESPVSVYLLRKNILFAQNPDYSQAQRLLAKMIQAQEDNAALKMLQTLANDQKNAAEGATLPDVAMKDVKGQDVTASQLRTGTWVIITFASWNYESVSRLRRTKTIRDVEKKNWKIMAYSFDVSKSQCKNMLSSDLNDYVIVCDEQMTASTVAQRLGLTQTGIALVVRDGKVLKHQPINEKFYDYLKTL